MRVLVATSNEGKLREYQRLLAGVPELVLETMATLGVKIDVDEDRNTFEGNALKKRLLPVFVHERNKDRTNTSS